MSSGSFSEEVLARIESEANPAVIPELVRTIRDQQRTIDSLQLKMDVALRDRDELRTELLRCREEGRRHGTG